MSTVAELRILAKESGIAGFTKMKKADLIEALSKASVAKGAVKPAEVFATTAPAEAAPAEATPAEAAPAEESVQKPKGKRSKKKVYTEVVDGVEVPAPKPVRTQRKPNSWNSFLSEYRKEHGCTLKEAMAKKDEYAAFKSKHATTTSE